MATDQLNMLLVILYRNMIFYIQRLISGTSSCDDSILALTGPALCAMYVTYANDLNELWPRLLTEMSLPWML